MIIAVAVSGLHGAALTSSACPRPRYGHSGHPTVCVATLRATCARDPHAAHCLAIAPFPRYGSVRLLRTKNGEARTLPLVGKLKDLVEHRKERRKLTRPDGTVLIADLVFHRDGRPIRDFRATWDDALDKAKVPRPTWHDFRRTAARNLVNAGVPEKVAMEITGHKTASIFRRYHITTQADRAAALRKAMALVESEQPEGNVKPVAEPGSGK